VAWFAGIIGPRFPQRARATGRANYANVTTTALKLKFRARLAKYPFSSLCRRPKHALRLSPTCHESAFVIQAATRGPRAPAFWWVVRFMGW
jgi:hypothetical protein